MWLVRPSEIADAEGLPTGRWRMTAKSDEGGSGPYGDTSHDHPTAEEAQNCNACDEYMASITGFPSARRRREMEEAAERKEYERLKAKFEGSPVNQSERT